MKREITLFGGMVAGVFHSELESGCRRPRGSDDCLLILTLSGAGLLTHANGQLVVPEGHVALYRPGAPHDYRPDPTIGRWTMIWSHFHPLSTWSKWLQWPECAPGLMHLHLQDPLACQQAIQAMTMIIELGTSQGRHRNELALNALERVLIWCHAAIPRDDDQNADAATTLALTFITAHLREPISLDDIAAASCQSVARLTHVFKRKVGLTPRQYIEQLRIDHAAVLLRQTSLSVGTIALQTGFENQFYFSLRFKRYKGISPREFRNSPVIPMWTWSSGVETIPVDPNNILDEPPPGRRRPRSSKASKTVVAQPPAFSPTFLRIS